MIDEGLGKSAGRMTGSESESGRGERSRIIGYSLAKVSWRPGLSQGSTFVLILGRKDLQAFIYHLQTGDCRITRDRPLAAVDLLDTLLLFLGESVTHLLNLNLLGSTAMYDHRDVKIRCDLNEKRREGDKRAKVAPAEAVSRSSKRY